MGKTKHRRRSLAGRISSWFRSFRPVAGSIAAGLVGGAGALHGVITGTTRALAGKHPAGIPTAIVQDYSGLNLDTGNFDQGQAMKSIGIVIVTSVIAAVIYFATHTRR